MQYIRQLFLTSWTACHLFLFCRPSYAFSPDCVTINTNSILESRDIIKSMDNRCNLTWAGKERASDWNRDKDFKEVQQVFARPLFTEESIFNLGETGLKNEIKNHFYYGDNLDVLQFIRNADVQSPVKLIYIDPPYMSQIKYNAVIAGLDESHHTIHAFEDRWRNHIDDYLNMLYPRLMLMHQILDAKGSIFVHVDWHVSHYVRLLLDEIFGREQFVNEIIWCYSGGSNTRRNLQRKHDTIFWYGRSQDYVFNPQYRPYTQGTVERGLTASKGGRYRLSENGAMLQDWWTDINKILSPTAYENLKYPTQKPKKLLERIINMASNPGDLVADFFGGSATTADVCNETGRSWLLCDNSRMAFQTTMNRLIKSESPPFKILHAVNQNESAAASGHKKQPVLNIKKPVLENLGRDKNWLSLGIDFYQPADIPEQWDAGQFASYIDFWEIDPAYDEHVFRSHYQFLRRPKQKHPVPLNLLIEVPRQKQYNMAIKLYDIFTNQSTVKICFEAESGKFDTEFISW